MAPTCSDHGDVITLIQHYCIDALPGLVNRAGFRGAERGDIMNVFDPERQAANGGSAVVEARMRRLTGLIRLKR